VFRSRRRDVVFPQSEHARLAGALAALFRVDDDVVAGILWHDRGYPPMDTDGIREVPPERWHELMRAGFAPETENPVMDHVVRMHIHRLCRGAAPDLAAELEPGLAASLRRSGLSAEAAAAADRVTEVCDAAAFDFCFEEPATGTAGGVRYTVDGEGGIAFDPWPSAAAPIDGWILAFPADGYPDRAVPVVVPFGAGPE
jgi:hypothetical protein